MEERGDKYCLALFGEKEQGIKEVDQRVVRDLEERGVKESPGGRSTRRVDEGRSERQRGGEGASRSKGRGEQGRGAEIYVGRGLQRGSRGKQPGLL